MRVKDAPKPARTGPTLTSSIIARKSAPVTTGVRRGPSDQTRRTIRNSFTSPNYMRHGLRILRARMFSILPVFRAALRQWIKHQRKSQRQYEGILRKRDLVPELKEAVMASMHYHIEVLHRINQAVLASSFHSVFYSPAFCLHCLYDEIMAFN